MLIAPARPLRRNLAELGMSVIHAPLNEKTVGGHHRDGLLGACVAFWRDLVATMFDSYHPERHYMRGPGPACARKLSQRS